MSKFRSVAAGALGVAVVLGGLGLGGCETTGSQRVRAKSQDATQATSTMVMLSKLDGEWKLAEPMEGMPDSRTYFAVSSAGSVVREIMAEGTPYEMTNLYHMDGNDVVCTHYCAAGNQPRMVAKGMTTVDGKPALDFKTDSVSNFIKGQDHYMGELRVVFHSDDRIEQLWTSFDKDGNIAHTMTFDMVRVQ